MPLSYPIPQRTAEKISRRAVQLARQNAPKKTGKGARGLLPMRRLGEVGIRVPPEVFYMGIQESGMKSFVMHGLAGRVIPIRLPSGELIFRTATPENIGRRRIISRDERGRILTTKLSWWHPGLKPKHFMRDAINQAIREWQESLTPEEVREVLDANPRLRTFLAELES
jgi:hypothetical protein